MTPIRVAYLVNVFPKLSETFIANEIIELRRQGVEVRVFSLRKPTEDMRHEMIVDSGLDQITSYDTENFSAALKEFKPQILHAHFATEPTEAARDFAAKLHIPFTFTAHGYDVFRKPPVDFAERALAAAGVVTVSQANAEYIAKTFSVPAKHVHVIPCGIDLEKFCPAPISSAEKMPPLILCVARLVKVKNLKLLLNACALLRDREISFRCVLIGDGPCREELNLLQKNLRLENFVEFRGAATQAEVRRWWQQADIGVLSSENEGMPVSLMEAAACGVPVVATSVGGIPELVDDGKTGLLVGANDVEQFASALEKLLCDKNLRRAFGQAARKSAEQKFDQAKQVGQLISLWSKILGAAS